MGRHAIVFVALGVSSPVSVNAMCSSYVTGASRHFPPRSPWRRGLGAPSYSPRSRGLATLQSASGDGDGVPGLDGRGEDEDLGREVPPPVSDSEDTLQARALQAAPQIVAGLGVLFALTSFIGALSGGGGDLSTATIDMATLGTAGGSLTPAQVIAWDHTVSGR